MLIGEHGRECRGFVFVTLDRQYAQARPQRTRFVDTVGFAGETQQLQAHKGPFVLATDYLKAYGEQLRAYIPGTFKVLGTDGFGRSDTRKKLRHFFEVSREFIVLSALTALAEDGKFPKQDLAKARAALGIAADKCDPTKC